MVPGITFKVNFSSVAKKTATSLVALFAIFGILAAGYVLGLETAYDPKLPAPTEMQRLEIQNDKLANIILAYQKLDELYQTQNTNVKTILNKNTDPSVLLETLSAMQSTNDLILVQQGKIEQLRNEN